MSAAVAARSMTKPPPAGASLAEDDDDLQVISAALQDAISTVGEIAYEPSRARRLTIALNRFCWECGGPSRSASAPGCSSAACLA